MVLTFLCLISFTAQSFVTATHIHHPGALTANPAHINVAAAGVTVGPAKNAPTPDQDDALHCPFCQAILLAGAAIGTTPVFLGLLALVTDVVAPPAARDSRENSPQRASHNRGPPHA